MKLVHVTPTLFVLLNAIACSEVEVEPEADASSMIGDAQDASAGVDAGPAPQPDADCPSITATIDEHLAAHRVFIGRETKGFEEGYYYVNRQYSRDVTESLGTDGSRTVTLYKPGRVPSDWTADPRLCVNVPLCGDGFRNPTPTGSELCDGTDLGGSTCADHGFLGGGPLTCTDSCNFDTSDCEVVCGNGIVEPGERCDVILPRGSSCAEHHSRFLDGELSCTADCQIDESACRTAVCGDGVLEGGEDCEGTNFSDDSPRTCAQMNPGWESGMLVCNEHCQLDMSECVSYCGNGRVDDHEECDGDLRAPEYIGKTCSDMPVRFKLFPFNTTVNHAGGELRCDGCRFDVDQCIPPPGCYFIPRKFGSEVLCYP